MRHQRIQFFFGFSPVAGIQWVETDLVELKCKRLQGVSVPLPGFSGLRLPAVPPVTFMDSFSPVAGIQWVETSLPAGLGYLPLVSVPLPGFSGLRPVPGLVLQDDRCFSPVAGIQWVETLAIFCDPVLEC